MRYIAHSLSIFLTLGVATGFTKSASADDVPPKAQQTSPSLPALAISPPAARPSDSSLVKDHVRRGQRARNAGRWIEAHAAYKAAFDAVDPATSTERERAELAGELGLCEVALHRYRDAAEHLAKSLEQREVLPDALQRRFEAAQREAAKRVATLVLSVDPPDAEVLIDGERIGRTARTYTLFFEPGKHMVRGRAPGHEDGLHSFLAAAGAQHEITMKLPRAAVSSVKETAPASPTEAPRGLSLSSWSGSMRKVRPPSPWVAWPGALRVAGIAVTTGTVLGGGVFMLRARKLDDDLSERRDGLTRGSTSSSTMCWQAPQDSPCADLLRLRDARNLSAGVGTALVITGGVIGAVTAASFFTDFSFLGGTPTQERVHVTPVATGGETGVRIEGLW
ncbi:PEGA domain-containing protein [Sorangium cellulosum]|uniref:PEGA domain-containing protein n=1 Tax=Sorangium cellulosum TaxID=56 RepID=UPI0005D1559C|nr:PEGA domain-containing protein [Sorangium cellulosum]